MGIRMETGRDRWKLRESEQLSKGNLSRFHPLLEGSAEAPSLIPSSPTQAFSAASLRLPCARVLPSLSTAYCLPLRNAPACFAVGTCGDVSLQRKLQWGISGQWMKTEEQ